MFTEVILKTGRRVTKGVNYSAHGLAKAPYIGHRFRALPPLDSPNIFNTAGVPSWDIDGNATYGDCEDAEEGNGKAVSSTATGAPAVVIPSANVIAWARKYGYLNGADTPDVLTTMQQHGMIDAQGKEHKGGPFGAINWTDESEVQYALKYFKGLKAEVAASQLQQVVGDHSGWFLVGASRDMNIDHCVGFYDCGTADFLAKSYSKKYNLPIQLPAGLAPDQFCVGLYTWGTIGIVDAASINSITGGTYARIADPDRGDIATWAPQAQALYGDIVEIKPIGPAPVPEQHPTRRAAELFQHLVARHLAGDPLPVQLLNEGRRRAGLLN